jgi:hypothetical protein
MFKGRFDYILKDGGKLMGLALTAILIAVAILGTISK